jgi:hypothetical protein
MKLATAARRVREACDAATDSTMFALYETAREMSWPGAGMDAPHPLDTQRALHITLRDGFRGHTIVIVVDGREVCRRLGVITDPRTSRADAVELVVGPRLIQVVVSVTPGDYVASLDLDVAAHAHLAISLVGEGTVSFETSAHRFM